MQKDIILDKLEEVRNFKEIYTALDLDKYESVLVPDKEVENRYRIERNDTNKVLKINRAVSKEFKLLSNKKILEIGSKLLENNENLIITSASSKNYGENIFLEAKIKNFKVNEELENIQGIGKVEPNLFINIPVIGNINFITSAYQIFCQNQVIALSSNPLTKAVSITHDSDIENKIDNVLVNFQNIESEFNSIINQLAVFKEFNINDEDYNDYLGNLFNASDITKDKPRLYKTICEKYLNAPNSSPGNLLGAYNSITNYIATNNYKNSELKYFSKLPTSNQYNLAKNAYKLATTVIKVGTNILN